MSRTSPLPKSRSKSSLLSETAYHSFHDIHLYEAAVSSSSSTASGRLDPCLMSFKERPGSMEMRRQDSGYESAVPRTSEKSGRRRRTSTTSSSTSGSRSRPSVRRAVKSGPVAHLPGRSLQASPVRLSQPHAPTTYFHFPSPDPAPEEDYGQSAASRPTAHPYSLSETDLGHVRSEAPSHPIPPPSTHYWTSDRTRRLEYAAIDAASRGVKGWVMRHVVPDCFVPKDQRRIGFDDDRGSVRRYRLELESEESADRDGFDEGARKKGWFWGTAA